MPPLHHRPEIFPVCESRVEVSQRVNELASGSVGAVELASARTVRCGRTSVFTKNTHSLCVKFAHMSIDFHGKLGYNCYCDKIVKL